MGSFRSITTAIAGSPFIRAAPPGVPAQSATNICVMNLLAAQVWHYWLAVPLTVVTVLTVFKLVAGYVQKVVAPRYPKR